MPAGPDADIVFTELRAGGSDGCGRFSVPYVTDLTSSLVFGPVTASIAGCAGDTRSRERGYLAGLARVAGYAIAGDGTLTMSDANGTEVLTFEPTTPASVVGHWIITSVNDGRGGMEAASAQRAPSLLFDPDGTVGGFDGCARFWVATASMGARLRSVRSCRRRAAAGRSMMQPPDGTWPPSMPRRAGRWFRRHWTCAMPTAGCRSSDGWLRTPPT